MLKGTGNDTPLSVKIRDRRILTDNRRGGVFIWFMAFCYQVAELCYYPKVHDDLVRREQLRNELARYKKEESGIQPTED